MLKKFWGQKGWPPPPPFESATACKQTASSSIN